jgi:hypothetical protein
MHKQDRPTHRLSCPHCTCKREGVRVSQAWRGEVDSTVPPETLTGPDPDPQTGAIAIAPEVLPSPCDKCQMQTIIWRVGRWRKAPENGMRSIHRHGRTTRRGAAERGGQGGQSIERDQRDPHTDRAYRPRSHVNHPSQPQVTAGSIRLGTSDGLLVRGTTTPIREGLRGTFRARADRRRSGSMTVWHRNIGA